MNTTLFNELLTFKQIQIHRPKHQYPKNDVEWGDFLSGLIDGDGWISRKEDQPKICICFHEKDVSLAYKIKEFIGYGTVSKYKGKRAFKYILTSRLGLAKICRIVKNTQVFEKRKRFFDLCELLNVPTLQNKEEMESFLLNSYWLAGFIDADGYLKIYIRYRKDRPNPFVLLTITIEQNVKNEQILIKIKQVIGGSLYYSLKKNSVCYSSNSLKNTKKLINYLDSFHLCSNKYKEYVIWRRAFLHRNNLTKIKSFQNRLKSLRK